MAALSADHTTFSVDGETDALALPLRAAAADIFYRGGLAWDSATGIILTDPGDAGLFRGVVAERTTTAAANDRVKCYIYGHFKFACANFTIANEGALFRGNDTDLDNPTGLNTTAAGANILGVAGALTTVETTAVDGWLFTNPGVRD